MVRDASLVGQRREWSPEEAARYEIALCKGLARDKKAQRVHFQKLRVSMVQRSHLAPPFGEKSNSNCTGAGRAGARPEGRSGSPSRDAAGPRKRRQKSDAQRQKCAAKLQHKWLQKRCEAAAQKVGGSPPRVLARVFACCGRFLQLLLPEGAELMQRLRQASAKPVRITGPVELGPSAAMGEVAAVETTNATTPSDMDMDEAASSSECSIRGVGGRKASQQEVTQG